ncbi:MAG: saccharopine dehydrogenase NADP-binding domain-containing protein [Polyangiaceae bacterium]|nr:saccharopine dehydrogenase NADP-binding domain-containing protein [Polyangiaceae bacterium]
MRAIVLGSGRMGRAAAWDLARQPRAERVCIVDRDAEALRAAERELAALLARTDPGRHAPIEARQQDLAETAALPELLRGFDVVLSAADYRFHEAVTRAAIEAGCHMCDLGGNVFVVDAQLALHEAAAARGVTVVPDCGLAPGLAGLLAAWGVERLGSADAVTMRVGGLPAHPKPPLHYKLVFSARGLVNEYLEPSEALRDGKIVRLPSLTDVETLDFPAPFGTLEAFNTSGGASTLPRTLAGKVRDLDYKTIRYPGHCAAFAAMHALGLLSETPVDGVSPRALTEKLILRHLSDDDTDVALVRVTVTGLRDGRRGRLVFEIVDRHSDETGHSAMARTTAYPAAAIAHMLATGAIDKRGVLPGELAVPLAAFVAAVRARGIEIAERWQDA